MVFFWLFFSTYTAASARSTAHLVNNARISAPALRHMIRHVLLPSALTWIFSEPPQQRGLALIGPWSA